MFGQVSGLRGQIPPSGDAQRGQEVSEDLLLKPVPVSAVSALAATERANLAIYLPRPSQKAPILYHEPELGEAHPRFDRLSESGVSHILVRGDDLEKCEKALESRLRDLLKDPRIRPDTQASSIQHVVTALARDLISGQDVSKQTERTSNLLDVVVTGVLSDSSIGANLLHMATHHHSTASHMFAVSILAVLLGAEVFGRNEETLRELGMAGLLHDLGKVTIDAELLNKQSSLSSEEIQLIRHHPIESVRLIGDDPLVNTRVRQMILQHHERFDGGGYPLGLTGSELLTESRILAIVDSFHAIIGRRSYRDELQPAEAMRVLRHQAGTQFDRKLCETWESVFGRCWRVAPPKRAPEAESPEPGTAYHADHRSKTIAKAQRKCCRLLCEGRAKVKCYYVGRLCNVNMAPAEFISPLHDLSRSGLCMHTGHAMYPGEVVHILIEAEGVETWVKGVVRWCRPDSAEGRHKIGIKFEDRISSDTAGRPVEVLELNDPSLFPGSTPATS